MSQLEWVRRSEAGGQMIYETEKEGKTVSAVVQVSELPSSFGEKRYFFSRGGKLCGVVISGGCSEAEVERITEAYIQKLLKDTAEHA